MRVPSVPGVLSPDDVLLTARSIAAVQRPSGAIPWFEGGHLDPWDHVQAAMGLTAAGFVDEAQAAFAWSRSRQRPDGSWAIRYERDEVVDAGTDANFCAYVATGVWHHWLATGDLDLVETMWPTVSSAIGLVLSMQRADGAVAWARGDGGTSDDALVTGSASIQLSLRCAAALGELVGDAHPEWELAAARVRHTLHRHPEAFVAKPRYSMDWYYPVLTGAVPAAEAAAWFDERWDAFVVPDLGARCVDDHPWVTGGETAELALALDAAGRSFDATTQLAAMQHLRHDDGSYWTGLVYADDKRWPVERASWTGATVVLAADALSGATPAGGLFRGDGLPHCDWEVSEACPCLLTS